VRTSVRRDGNKQIVLIAQQDFSARRQPSHLADQLAVSEDLVARVDGGNEQRKRRVIGRNEDFDAVPAVAPGLSITRNVPRVVEGEQLPR
jgi:hypothetical protein